MYLYNPEGKRRENQLTIASGNSTQCPLFRLSTKSLPQFSKEMMGYLAMTKGLMVTAPDHLKNAI